MVSERGKWSNSQLVPLYTVESTVETERDCSDSLVPSPKAASV